MYDTRLEPFYWQLPEGLVMREGFEFKILGFSKSEDYVLVGWSFGKAGGESTSGEILYKGKEVVKSGGGQIPLFQDRVLAVQSATPRRRPSVWDEVPQHHGADGIPPKIAKTLRDTLNWVYF